MNSPFSTVLVVASDSSFRQALQIVLRRSGYLVISTEDPKLMSKVCGDVKVHLVLFDASSSEHEALESLSELRQINTNAELPVVLLTSAPDLGALSEINDKLEMPLVLDELLGAVRAHCKHIDREAGNRTKLSLSSLGAHCA